MPFNALLHLLANPLRRSPTLATLRRQQNNRQWRPALSNALVNAVQRGQKLSLTSPKALLTTLANYARQILSMTLFLRRIDPHLWTLVSCLDAGVAYFCSSNDTHVANFSGVDSATPKNKPRGTVNFSMKQRYLGFCFVNNNLANFLTSQYLPPFHGSKTYWYSKTNPTRFTPRI